MLVREEERDLLAELGITENDVPRFRSIMVSEADPNILILRTRTGGGNREMWESKESAAAYGSEDLEGPYNEDLYQLPGYLYNEDSEIDYTFARFFYDRTKAKTEMELKKKGQAEEVPEVPMITIRQSEYEQLVKDQAKLNALEAAGVDNWEWYGDAISSLMEND